MEERTYIAIDLKSFYASVECVERGLDPLSTNLVVADAERTEKTICLAVSPSLKAYGISGRPRLFEVIRDVREINRNRCEKAPGRYFTGKSYIDTELRKNSALELDYIVATPQMNRYMAYSTAIYQIYLRYIAPEDIHVYSVDEVFIDATSYLETSCMTPYEFTMKLIHEVLKKTGITATAGIGTNLYLCKIAMDIKAKHIVADKDGVRIASLDEISYRRELWTHQPLTDFWRIGRGISRKLEAHGMYTMGDVARMSDYHEELLYNLFGVNAELLIDHAWGWEPCRMKDIKEYTSENKSISSGQVLKQPYSFEKGRLIVREMADLLTLDLVKKHLVTDRIVLTVGYDIENLTQEVIRKSYKGPVVIDRYGRRIPKVAHGTIQLGYFTSSSRRIVDAASGLFDRITDRRLLIRRVTLVADHVFSEERDNSIVGIGEQMLFLSDYAGEKNCKEQGEKEKNRERRRQETVIEIQRRYGKNAIIKGMNLEKGAMTIERNQQVGGHRA